MYVSDIMSQTTAVRLDQDSGTAFQMMHEKGLDFLPVIDSSETVVGVLARAHAERAVNRFHSVLAEISDIMDSGLGVVTSNTPLAAAAQRMIEDRVDVMLVTDSEGRGLGIITSSDLHRALVGMLGENQGFSHHAA